MTRSRRLKIISGIAALGAVACLWVLFAPSQIGGSVDYVIIRGVSMEPRLHSGDLAVVRRQASYSVGEVAGYQSGLLHEFVLHRIVAKKGGHFLFKGDHNDFIDSYVPTQPELAGRLWFDIPHGGVPIRWLHVPMHAGILGGLIGLLALGGGGAAGVRRRRVRPQGGEQRAGFGNDLWLFAAPAVAALAFGLLAAAAFTQPRTRIVPDGAAFVQAGAYSYSSAVPASSVYPDGVVRSTDPIYPKLVKRLRIALHYRFSSSATHSVRGTISLRASVRNADGWRSLLASSPEGRFSGDRAAAALTLDLRQVYRQMTAFARDTGITNESFSLDVVPSVTLRGKVGVSTLSRPAALAPLTFTVDSQRLAIAQRPSTTTAVSSPPADPLVTEQAGSANLRAPATLRLLKLRIGVARAKEVGVLGAGFALLAALAGLCVAAKRRRASELTRILSRYGAWIVPINSPLACPKIVDVSSMDALVRLAEHYERAILHEEQGRSHSFALEEDGTLFRYRIHTGDVQPLRAEQPIRLDEHIPAVTRFRR